MSRMLANARRAGLLLQEAYHKRQAEKKPKSRARSRVHRKGRGKCG